MEIGTLNLEQVGLYGAALIFLQQVLKLIYTTAEVEIKFYQKNKHARKEMELEFHIQEKKMELEAKKREIVRKEDDQSSNLLEDALKIQARLKEIREHTNAKNVSIALYHNGIAKGFKNYSVRYEEFRSKEFSIMQEFQSKPLTPYFSVIEDFKSNDVLKYDFREPVRKEGSDAVYDNMEVQNTTEMYVCGLLIPADEVVMPEHKIMKIKLRDMAHYLVGVITVSLDQESNSNDYKSYLHNRVDDIINIYEKNNKVFL